MRVRTASALMIGLCWLAWSITAHATVLTFEGLGTNDLIPASFGSNVAIAETGISISGGATPNISLTWSVEVNNAFDGFAAQLWEFYNGDPPEPFEWQAAQLNNVYEAFSHNITFTPANGYGVLVDSFVIDDYADYKLGNELQWRLYQDSTAGKLIASGTETTFDGENKLILTNMASHYFGTVVLQFIGGNDPDDNEATTDRSAGDYRGIDDLAIDNISFTEAVPEPQAVLLAIMGMIGIGLWSRKRA